MTLPYSVHLKRNRIKPYPIPKQVGNRIFVVTPYNTDDEECLPAVIPDSCPEGYKDEKICRITVDHLRDRKTGPCFPLTVVKCHTHGRCFTLYPPGHYPYGRQLLVGLVDVDGKEIEISTEESAHPQQLESFEGTLFDAPLDADRSQAWPKESDEGSFQSRFDTQLHHIDRATRLLGTHPSLEVGQVESITEILDLPGQLVAERRVGPNCSPTFKEQGQTVCQLLRIIPKNRDLFERLTETGAIADLWPFPFFWNSKTKRLQRSSFHLTGIRGSPR